MAEGNRAVITEAIEKYMRSVPEPKTLPVEIRVEIRFEEATEVHVISLAADLEAQRKATESAAAIAKMYNEICADLPKVRAMTPQRRRAVLARLRRYSVDDFVEVFKKAQASDFLCGRNDRAWTANFDWLISESNMAKVLEGNYDNKRAARCAPEHSSFDTDEAFASALARSYGG